jgi:hypothetical protein
LLRRLTASQRNATLLNCWKFLRLVRTKFGEGNLSNGLHRSSERLQGMVTIEPDATMDNQQPRLALSYGRSRSSESVGRRSQTKMAVGDSPR